MFKGKIVSYKSKHHWQRTSKAIQVVLFGTSAWRLLVWLVRTDPAGKSQHCHVSMFPDLSS